ncbi:hypothetical protein DFH28DRAFT_874025, partial [Melampsora americana]
MDSTPSSQQFQYLNSTLPPSTQPSQPTQLQYSSHGHISYPQYSNQPLPPPSQTLFDNSQASPTEPPPLNLNHQTRPDPNIYFRNRPHPPPRPGVPEFHPPIIPSSHLHQGLSQRSSNPAVSSFRGVPSLERPEPSRLLPFGSQAPAPEVRRPASSRSDDLPQLDYSIIDDFESQAFEHERQAIISRN